MKNEVTKKQEYYRALPYGIILRKDEEGDWIARIEELPGCTAHGATQADALKGLNEVMEVWIEDAVMSGAEIPEPRIAQGLPSGKWLQRVPRSLHKKLVEEAAREGVSLNQLVTSMLAEAVGLHNCSPEVSEKALHEERMPSLMVDRPKRAVHVRR